MSRICDSSPYPKLVKTDITLSLHHHLNIIFKMIKFISLALLCFSLSGEINAKFYEDKIGKDGYNLVVRFDDADCCNDLKKNPEPVKPKPICLDNKNSKAIADAINNVIHDADELTYQVLKDLRIAEFMSSRITYHEWSENIKYGQFNYVGFSQLQKLVSKFVLCKKVCKVFFFLREAIRKFAAVVEIGKEPEVIDGKNYLRVDGGDLIVLGDVRKDVELKFQAKNKGVNYDGVVFRADSIIIDTNLLSKDWEGKNILVEVDNVIVTKNHIWNVAGKPRKHHVMF